MQKDKSHTKIIASTVSELISEVRKMRKAQTDFLKNKNTSNYKTMTALEDHIDALLSGTYSYIKEHHLLNLSIKEKEES